MNRRSLQTLRTNEPDPAFLQRIRAEFLEMPGLCLTVSQASLLWGADVDTCWQAIRRLMAEGFVRLTRDGAVACCDIQH